MFRFVVSTVLLLSAIITSPVGAQTPEPGAGTRRPRLLRLFERADVNKDGQISRDEWKGRPQAFDRLDQNHDGVITLFEARRARVQLLKRRIRALRRMDVNHDRQISREEWTGKPEMFDRLDRNHDGFLTREELVRAHRARRRAQ